MMMLTMTVEEIRKNCPSILSLEQVRCILHISKRKAAWLLQNGHIGCTIGEKKTRQYSVPRSELIKYIEKCSKGKAPSVPYGIFSTQKYPSQRKERAIRISQTTITNLKIELRAEWSKSPTVLTTTQAAKLVGCSNDLINSWMKKEDGLRFVRAQNGVFTTKEWLIDYFAHYTKEKNQDIAFQNKKHPKGIGEISDAFLVKKFLGISKNYLRFLAQHVIIRKIPNKNHKCLCLYKGGINLAGKRGPTPTKQIIIKSTSELFFENGFSKTTATELCKKANISTGNLTFYFPTKEHILADLVKMMCDFQWREMENAADEGRSSLLAYCLELTTMVAVGEEIPQMYDFFIAAYAHQIPLDIIRANDVEKIKKVFAEYTEGWDDERFIETEALISGIEYATLSSTEHSASMEHRIEGALNTIMMLFDVPEETRKMKVAKVLAMDYRAIGRKVYENFKRYVTETNEHNLEEISKSTKAKSKK